MTTTAYTSITGPRLPQNFYRPQGYVQQPAPQRPIVDVRDDYERWYTETVPSNRMSLSLRSGILSEVGWGLERLCRLCHNERFEFSSIPGLIDGLFDWPEWYITEGYKASTDSSTLFSPPQHLAKKRRFALESLFILRNASFLDANASELLRHSHTLPLIMNSLQRLCADKDEDAEFLLHILDLYHIVATRPITPSTPPSLNPLPVLQNIVSTSSNRSMIITAFNALILTYQNPTTALNLTANDPALSAAIRYLPLLMDKPMVEACLNYLFIHISHMTMAKAFMLRAEMPSVLKLLVSVLLSEQPPLEEKVAVDVTGPVYTAPSTTVETRDHDLTKEELDNLLPLSEPQRCYDWMRTMFAAKADGELTQVEFWNLYKDVFAPYQEQFPLLVASDVIKNVNTVFPQAQAMVLSGPVQKFIVRGVDRRKDMITNERFKCKWDQGQCGNNEHQSPGELYDHLLEHINGAETSDCLWATCSTQPTSKHNLRVHVLTHLASLQPPSKHPSQSDTITLSAENAVHPTSQPTRRPIPPSRTTIIQYNQPTLDPPSSGLTALLCIRIIFRTAFASAEAAPRADVDHFGFPGLAEEQDDQPVNDAEMEDSEREGMRRGRMAFVGVRWLLEGVRLRDEVLMSWVGEMVDAGISGTQRTAVSV